MSVRPLGATPVAGRVAVLAVLAALALAFGGYGLARADGGLTTRRATVDGVPLTEVRAAGVAGRRPGVVIAHGFAGSARLMRPIADTVARQGAVALLLDVAGHGANPARLPGAGRDAADSRATLEHDLSVAVAYLRSRPDVDPARIVLVGHSMGAGAVIRYAAGHPDVTRTVAISLPDSGDLPDGRPDGLLLIVGGAEFPAFRDTAETTSRRGVGRRLVVVPGVEHISVLFAGRTHDEVAAWVGGGGDPPRPLARLAPAGLLLFGFGLGFVPLAILLLGRRPRPSRRAAPTPVVLAVAASAAGLGALVGALAPTTRLPLAVGGHVTGFLLVTGVLLAAAARWWPLPAATVTPVRATAPVARRAPVRSVIAAVLLTGYAVTAVAVPIHLGFTSALPVGDRWWLLPVVAAACLVFLTGAELATAGRSWRYAAVGGIAVLALTALALVGLAPGFVLLVVPLFAVLVGWQAAWAAVLRRAGAPRWLPALVGAALLAWPMATTLPLS
ncbi:Alpha/beta hydrolase family protein [Micromonospora purpureochromogenes]|uniref:Alpha/beta hydrolase family protein n=1 Tax=Micromonospora purpureochromogenes TaxID=47872 RepID=A0A1C5A573_9ACTN|nr:alpha/beta fold hydrolase [Micromonospora purpureochromogenes]SCF40383.1 Alpha/beta hydrolase family protein [Micromonospora purpureochromogenes]